MFTHYSVLYLLYFATISVLSQLNIPPNFPRCEVNFVNLGDCMVKATADIRERLIQGIPGLKMVPITLYPIAQLNFEQRTKSLNYSATLTNVTLKGLENYKFMQLDLVNRSLVFDFILPKLDVTGNFKASGKFFGTLIDGNGSLALHFFDIHVQLTMLLKDVEVDGIKYLKPIQSKSNITLANVEVDFDQNKKGQDFSKATKAAFSQNKARLMEELKPTFQKTVEKFMEEYVKNHILNIPYKHLFITK